MEADTAKLPLADGADTEEPVFLPPDVLPKLTLYDLPQNAIVEIGVPKDGVMHLEWIGNFLKVLVRCWEAAVRL
jgi:hypothetical protein